METRSKIKSFVNDHREQIDPVVGVLIPAAIGSVLYVLGHTSGYKKATPVNATTITEDGSVTRILVVQKDEVIKAFKKSKNQ